MVESVKAKMQKDRWLSRKRFETRGWLILLRWRSKKRCERLNGCQDKDSRQDTQGWMAVKAKIQAKMWRTWLWIRSRKIFKTRCKGMDGYHSKDSKQEDDLFCQSRDPRQDARGWMRRKISHTWCKCIWWTMLHFHYEQWVKSLSYLFLGLLIWAQDCRVDLENIVPFQIKYFTYKLNMALGGYLWTRVFMAGDHLCSGLFPSQLMVPGDLHQRTRSKCQRSLVHFL